MRACTLLPVGVLALWLTACTSPRKAAERACGKAERHMAKAVGLCPDLLKVQVQHDTVSVLVPGATGDGEALFTRANMDSVLTLCNTLVKRAQERAWSAKQALEEERAAKRGTPVQHDVVHRMRMALCDLEAVTYADSTIMLKVWTENGKLRYWYNLPAREVRAPVTTTTTRVATQAPCPPEGVASWYRWAFWILVVLMLLLMAWMGRVLIRSLEANNPHYGG